MQKNSNIRDEYFQIYLYLQYVQKIQTALHFSHIPMGLFFIIVEVRQRKPTPEKFIAERFTLKNLEDIAS